ncbi:lysophospholipid acyltransferase family protein [Amycolatopsis keratiniphila]|uniref:1-acyl-sn-glycerol-3-phosphate acyltransferase n=2 Tax=Amycolatopsis keratiniphila TaxID=129921 RepID=R4SLI8_9PSEU|nr:lysophospholipid acyltransferase family protein [Amycolatopsis keratiniphila]AGM03620.1 1-acyl-sn-glycerol-3-phosphate acyltransferase [Amycolatopsis keratiniphila]OLZ56930.1 1-acyl-sn-glycerol-3-phosphate acyltransferase [Amycolatopsis keratiniphila subsp. nogabecina]ONF65551.1 1-acyl-sn-glycerol-3-phosphate acyltransferase [Amycolatopsis keratiniphila subsp. keratiniphila]SDU48600.1 1-acyl-sn-glycerol-3-phosphate acyltransferase [Amycolatopsis keratiniphila]
MLPLLVRFVLGPLVRALYRPEIRGVENIPATGPVLLAPNHRAALDTGVITFTAMRQVKFLGKAEYFTGRGLKGKLMAGFLGGLGYVPVERGNAQAGLAALEAARKVLDAGGAFAIYPEGTRSLDGRLHRGHTGVAALALATGAKVVPVALTGTENLQPGGKRIPRRAKITVTYGAPLDFSRYEGQDSSPAIRRSVTDEIMYAILELSGQEYVDSYHKRPDQSAA